MTAGDGSDPAVLVSVVIPCYNPSHFLEETLASLHAQTYQAVEIIVVDDGTDETDARARLRSVAPRVAHFIEHPRRGRGAACNTGFRAASGAYLLPLDPRDTLEPTFVAACVNSLEMHPEIAFVYTDYHVFGNADYVERLPDYNLYGLLDQKPRIHASVIRRSDWTLAGGYRESGPPDYDDWDFWLRLGERDRYGYHLPRVLFHHLSASMLTEDAQHRQERVDEIQASHPHLYSRECRGRIKTRWAPAVCVLGAKPVAAQTIEDLECLDITDGRLALERSTAEAFLLPARAEDSDPHDAELCALTVWGGNSVAKLSGGAVCLSRSALKSGLDLDELRRSPESGAAATSSQGKSWPGPFETLRRHLVNAELTSLDNWLRHPIRSAGRLIPVRVKKRINRTFDSSVFDLKFYDKFQPQSVRNFTMAGAPLVYIPRAPLRRRIALITPHLGPGGAENVFLDIANAVERQQFEVFLITTRSQDSRWRPRWEQIVDHIYDLAVVVPSDRMVAALYSMTINWEFDIFLMQNSFPAYGAIPYLRRERPKLKIIDLIHAVDPEWDFVSSTEPVAAHLDLRLAISDAGRQRLLQAGTPEQKIRLIRSGIDLQRFRPASMKPVGGRKNILFAARLDPVKHPLLLVEIAAKLSRLRPQRDFHFLVAGDGPEKQSLCASLRSARLDSVFTLLGYVEDMPALLAEADVLILPSRGEGIPLAVLEAFATAKPVVCSRVGALPEVVDSSTGILIEPGPGEAAGFAAAINRLLADPELGYEMGRAGQRKVEAEYNREQSRKAYRNLFASCLES